MYSAWWWVAVVTAAVDGACLVDDGLRSGRPKWVFAVGGIIEFTAAAVIQYYC